MRIHTDRLVLLILAAALLLGAAAAQGAVQLRFAPGDTLTVNPGGSGRLAIELDDAIRLRTVEVTVTYDTTVVHSLGGGSGSLFLDSGLQIYDGFEESSGVWHAYAVILGAGDYVTGPGELLVWDFEGEHLGSSAVTSVDVALYDEASPPVLVPDVTLPNSTIIVKDYVTPVTEPAPLRPGLRLAPNPFNPRTRIRFDLETAGPAHLEVFDLRGRRVAELYDGFAEAGELSARWNGRDDQGRDQPGGTYLFRLTTRQGAASAKGILLK